MEKGAVLAQIKELACDPMLSQLKKIKKNPNKAYVSNISASLLGFHHLKVQTLGTHTMITML